MNTTLKSHKEPNITITMLIIHTITAIHNRLIWFEWSRNRWVLKLRLICFAFHKCCHLISSNKISVCVYTIYFCQFRKKHQLSKAKMCNIEDFLCNHLRHMLKWGCPDRANGLPYNSLPLATVCTYNINPWLMWSNSVWPTMWWKRLRTVSHLIWEDFTGTELIGRDLITLFNFDVQTSTLFCPIGCLHNNFPSFWPVLAPLGLQATSAQKVI